MSYCDSHLFWLIYFSYHSMHFGIDSFDINLSSFEKSWTYIVIELPDLDLIILSVH